MSVYCRGHRWDVGRQVCRACGCTRESSANVEHSRASGLRRAVRVGLCLVGLGFVASSASAGPVFVAPRPVIIAPRVIVPVRPVVVPVRPVVVAPYVHPVHVPVVHRHVEERKERSRVQPWGWWLWLPLLPVLVAVVGLLVSCVGRR
jgi:hypothetical protein